jgi:glycosyltransferase involved in cell wall biosynthesis
VARARGINVVGYLRSESGVGQAARAVVSALDAAGLAVLPVHPHDVPPSRQGTAFATVAPEAAGFGTTLLCVTAYETPGFAASVPERFFAGRRTIGLWWWEVDVFPDFMRAGFEHVDEVWVGSEHIARAIGPWAGEIPVRVVRVPVVRAPATTLTRADLGLPAGPVFLTVFGYYSSVARKNPAGAIEAFMRAFAPGEGPTLVVKAIDHEAHPDEHAKLEELAARHPDVHLMPGYVDEARMHALVQHADAVVSLHRAEGFGFTPAEAMAVGKPVIATGYSGNLDYMHDENAFLVDGPLVPIGPEGAPYPAEGLWADPDLDQAATFMRLVVEQPEVARERGRRAERDMAERYSPAAAGETMRARLAEVAGPDPLALRSRVRAARLARTRVRR